MECAVPASGTWVARLPLGFIPVGVSAGSCSQKGRRMDWNNGASPTPSATLMSAAARLRRLADRSGSEIERSDIRREIAALMIVADVQGSSQPRRRVAGMGHV